MSCLYNSQRHEHFLAADNNVVSIAYNIDGKQQDFRTSVVTILQFAALDLE